MADITLAVLAAAAVGGALLILGRRAIGASASAESGPSVEPAYGDLAAEARRLQEQTTPPAATAISAPVLRVRAGTKTVEVSWAFDVPEGWSPYVAWLDDRALTGFRRETAPTAPTT